LGDFSKNFPDFFQIFCDFWNFSEKKIKIWGENFFQKNRFQGSRSDLTTIFAVYQNPEKKMAENIFPSDLPPTL